MQNTLLRSKRLSPIMRLAERKEKNAATTMARARQRLHYYEEKLAELRNYRNEYGVYINDPHADAMTINRLREYQVFIQQLNEGISILAEKVEGQRQLKRHDEQQWLAAKKNTGVLDKLIIKLKWMERKFAANLEANEIDERAARNTKTQF